MSKKIPVMECFGPTIQGEGMVIGRKTMFIRTGGCDYSCSWCDSAFTWNGEEKARLMTPEEIATELGVYGGKNFNHVTISGGNPALFGQPMEDLILMLKLNGAEVGLETQGSKWQDWFYLVDDLTISPKPPSSGMETDWEVLDDIVNRLNDYQNSFTWSSGLTKIDAPEPKFSLKVVVFNDEDFEYAKEVNKRYGYPKNFYLSVGNEDSKEDGDISGRLLNKLDWLWDKVINECEMNNAKPLPQLHTLIWQNKRGV